MTCVSPDGRITPGCLGLWNDEQEAGWKRMIDFVHGQTDAKFGIQLGHAGRKGSTKLAWDGTDQPLDADNWPLISASPIPYLPVSQVPREMTREDMDRVKADFVAAATRAARAGADMLELHCAHGYLLSAFLSPLTNRRTDDYGGSHENRARFPLEVFHAIRAVWPEDRPISVRLSCNDWADGGNSPEDAAIYARMFKDAGADMIDCSSGQVTKEEKPTFGRSGRLPSPTRSATRWACRRSPSVPSSRPITPTRSSPPAAPTSAPSPARCSPTPPGRCTRRPRSGSPRWNGRSSISPASASTRPTPPARRVLRRSRGGEGDGAPRFGAVPA